MKNYFKKITLIFLTLFVLEFSSFIILKYFTNSGTYRTIVSPKIFDYQTGFMNQPNYIVKSKGSIIEINEFGHPKTPIKHEKPELNIAITGGSVIFGIGSSNNENSIPSLIEKKIYDKYGIKAEVTNLGVRSYNYYQEMMLLYHYLVDNKPDIIISLSGFNDVNIFTKNYIFDPLLFKKKKPNKTDFITHAFYLDKKNLINRAINGEVLLINLNNLVRKHFYTFELLFRAHEKYYLSPKIHKMKKQNAKILTELNFDLEDYPNKDFDSKIDLFFKNISMVNTLSKENGAKYFYILQPTLYRLENFDNESNKEKIQKKLTNYLYEKINSQKEILPVFDISKSKSLVEKKDIIFRDTVHLNDEGSNIVAEEIIKIINKEL